MNEPVKVVVGEVGAHTAQTRRYLFANLFLAEGVKL